MTSRVRPASRARRRLEGAVEIAADLELQVPRGAKGGPPGLGRIDAREAKFSEIEPVDEGIDDANRIVLVGPVFEAFRQQRRLRSIGPFNELRRRPSPNQQPTQGRIFHTARVSSLRSRQ
jgi:hypothetical protein